MAKEITFKNGEPVEAICNNCQRPGANVRHSDGELYHDECVPEDFL